jgi:hypothetical protein
LGIGVEGVDVDEFGNGIGWFVKEGHWCGLFSGLGQMSAWYGI